VTGCRASATLAGMDAENKTARLTMSELTLLLEGSEIAGRIALSPPPFELRAPGAPAS
jgi:hypothetical protein